MAEERMDPVSACAPSFWEHVYRYRFAVRYVRGKRVLDIACGEGYGTAALRRAGAGSVLGIDLSQEACRRARDRYGERFCAGDAHAIPLADHSMDVIVSFETIEHIERPEAFLDECVRVLAPRGVLILSTPNKEVHNGSGQPNPFHCSEMKEEDFLSLLSTRFRHTRRYVQMVKSSPWWSPRSIAATHPRWVRFKGGWRAREWARSFLCPSICGEIHRADRHSAVDAILSRDRFLASWVNPYCVRPRSRSARERPWYLVSLCHDGRAGEPVKDPLRSATKRVFYLFYPALRVLWFLIKYVEYFVVHPLLSFLPLRWAHSVFRCRRPWLLLMPSEKELILRNLSIAFQGRLPKPRLAHIGAAYARFLSSLRFDAWISSSCSAKKLNESVRIEGLAHIRKAQEEGKAVLLLGCHTGYFYRFVFALARNGTRHHVITMRTEETGRIVWRGRAELALYRKILERMERDENIRVIYAGSAYREIRKSLEERQILLTKIDNPAPGGGGKGLRMKFLGLECVFSGEIFRMADEHDAVCLPYVVRVDRHFCAITIYPPWQPKKAVSPLAEEIPLQVEYFIRLFEEHILSCPEQWWLWRDLGAFQRPRP